MDPDLETAIRQAVAAGDFTRARRLWEEYGVQCGEHLRRDRDPAATLERARRLMVWCRQMALAARSQAQARLDRLAQGARVAQAYSGVSALRPGSVRAVRF